MAIYPTILVVKLCYKILGAFFNYKNNHILGCSLYHDCESFLLQGPNFIDDAHLTDLEEVFDPPLSSSPLVTPSSSSTPIDTTISASTLLASPYPLAGCTELGRSEPSTGGVSVIEDD